MEVICKWRLLPQNIENLLPIEQVLNKDKYSKLEKALFQWEVLSLKRSQGILEQRQLLDSSGMLSLQIDAIQKCGIEQEEFLKLLRVLINPEKVCKYRKPKRQRIH